MTDTSSIDSSSENTLLTCMRKDARAIFNAGLQAVAPSEAVRRYCRRQGHMLIIGDRNYDLHAFRRVLVVGAGKATAAMALALEELLEDHIAKGLICVKYGHTQPLKRIRTIEAGHPIPDRKGEVAAAEILKLVQQAGRDDLVIVLLSGGGSALLPLPAKGILLEEKQVASDILIGCGATIHEINAIRKHISAIKGGRLALAARPAEIITLVLSDVVGDNLDVIASGPTVPDGSTFVRCWEIIEHYGIADQMPHSIVTRLQEGLRRTVAETPKPSSHQWQHVHHQIIGRNLDALAAATVKADVLGYNTLPLSSRMEGETRTVAQVHGAIAREVLASRQPLPSPACLLSGGETTVTVRGTGLGGRNQEFALAAALDIAEAENIVVLSAGTDGTDGPTEAAGAFADHTTVQRARDAGYDVRRYLENNDAYTFFEQLRDLLVTGPTGTNVMDLRIVLIRSPHTGCAQKGIDEKPSIST